MNLRPAAAALAIAAGAIILDKNLTRVGVSVIYKDNHQHWTVTFAS
ncbi:hypothetical protein ACWEOI_21305 [Nocardia sp. NPDC004340]